VLPVVDTAAVVDNPVVVIVAFGGAGVGGVG